MATGRLALTNTERPSSTGQNLTAYDEVPYVSGARNATSVDRLAMLGRLLQMDSADPQRCRTLELGCGDGGNLIPMAIGFPESEFVGVDLAPTAIQRARRAVEDLTLPNISFQEGTFAQAPVGPFDYVIAHGVYSWVPAEAREELLETIRTRLAPHGMAFLSYNAKPGGHIRQVLREMMLLHTRDISDPQEKIAQARGLLGLLAHSPAEGGSVYQPILTSDAGKALQASDFLLYHDDLAEISQPFFFSEVIESAQRHHLQFASEANFYQMSLANLPPESAAPLAELAVRDLLAKEQYLDFLTCRAFRQTVLCHAEATLDRAIDLDRIRQLRFASNARRKESTAEGAIVEFAGPDQSVLRSDDPVAIMALDALAAAYPRSIAFHDLAAVTGAGATSSEESLAEVLFRAFSAGVIEFHLAEPAVVFDVTERPVASPWARYRASTRRVVNLYHESLGLDEAGAAVLALLDGKHGAADIAREASLPEDAVRREITDLAAHGLLIG